MTLNTERAVLLRYNVDGGWRRGSGLRIGGKMVLTAEHCAQGNSHKVIVDGNEYDATVAWRAGRPDIDIAVLIAPELPPLEQLSSARVDTSVASRIEGCVALGFPVWNDTTSKRRAQADGYVATGEGADPYKGIGVPDLLTFKITTPAIRDRPVEAGLLDSEATPWGGMSGAVIVSSHDQIIGVVRGHAPAAGVGSLTFTPLTAVDVLDPDEAAEFWTHLGVADRRVMAVLPVPEIGCAATVVGQIPAMPPGFVHRGALDRLTSRLDDATVAAVCAVTGMRGAGKTHIAAAYARSWIETNRGLVGWVNAETLDTAVTDLARIAEAVGTADPRGDSASSARRLMNFLATSPGNSLFVFDNATDPDGLRSYLPLVGRARVVITTIDAAFAEFGDVLDVEQFSRSESLDYLQGRTALDDAAGASELAELLGDLPLALAAAASTIRQRRHRDYSRYLAQIRAYPVEEVLRRPPAHDYPRSTAGALMLSIDSLDQDDPTGSAQRLIGVMSVLSPDGVRIELLEVGGFLDDSGANPLSVDDAIACCTRHSLLSRSLDDRVLTMHRLTARVVREHAAATGTLGDLVAHGVALLEANALALLELSQLDESEAWRQRNLGAHLAAQVEALWNNAAADAIPDIKLRALGLRTWAVQQLRDAADLTLAIEMGERTYADWKDVMGVDHPYTLRSRNDLARAFEAAGRLGEAIPIYERNLDDYQRVLGVDHPVTLTARNNVAYASAAAGKFDEAIALYEPNLRDHERVLGVDHPDTLSSRNNLASAYESAGRLDEAIELHERNLAHCERVLGVDHPDTLTPRNDLACAYASAGRLKEAIALHQQTLVARERVFGVDHPHTLASRNNLAGAYAAAGRLDEAIALHQETLTERERVLGLDHPHTLSSRNNLAYAYAVAGRFDDAIRVYQQNAADCERILGLDHPESLVSRNNLAGAYMSAARLDEAVALLVRSLADCERVLGVDHPNTLSARNNLAGAYRSVGRLDEEIALLERSVVDCERVLGKDNPLTLISRNSLAGAYASAGQLDTARNSLGRPRKSATNPEP